MKKVVENFFGPDLIASEQAKQELIRYGEQSLDLVIAQFGKKNPGPQVAMQLGDLFGHFGNAALPKLMAVFERGRWGEMIMATPCFSRLPYEPAGSQLMQFVDCGEIEKERLAIEAIGYLGTSDWSFKLKDKVTTNNGYEWEKLSHYLFVAFFRIAVKAKTQNEIGSSFFYINFFYQRAGAEKFRTLWNNYWFSMEILFSHFKPIAADVILSDWITNNDVFFRELGVKALGWMRLNRAVRLLKQMALNEEESENVVRQCAESLSMIDSPESAHALKAIFSALPKTSDLYSKIALHLAMTLGHLSDRKFVEDVYPELLALGGETEAHTLYNLGLLGFDESIWLEGVSSNDYVVRASVAPAYARRKGPVAIPKLLQMEREASHEIEKALILAALIVAGHLPVKDVFLSVVYALHKQYSLRMVRITWKREIVFALHLADAAHSAIWEAMAGIEVWQVQQEIASLENSFRSSNAPFLQPTEKAALPESAGHPNPEIFVSYSWGGESEQTVDAISTLFAEKKLALIRDKIALGYKGNIKEFMKRIGQGKYVVVIISDKYLKSDNCMFELLELKQNGNLYERIFPIVLDDAKIYRESERLDYRIYWDNEIKELDKKIKKLHTYSGTKQVIEKINQYDDIRRTIDDITDLLRNMNTLSPDMHKNGDFSALTSAICKAMAEDGYSLVD